MAWRLGGLLLALSMAAGLGVISIRLADRQSAVFDACGAAETKDFNRALQLTDGMAFDGSSGRSAAECRCVALLGSGRAAECELLMEGVLADPRSEGWSPGPRLAVHLIQTRRDAGRALDAARLARRAARQHPNSGDLFYLELSTRAAIEDEEALLRELAARIDPKGPDATRMRVSLATRYLIRGDPTGALRALGDGPPTGHRDSNERWFDTKGMAFAHARDLDGVRRTYQEWRRAGGYPAELRARYALTLSIVGLADPDRTPTELLQDALLDIDGITHEPLIEAVATRLILTLVDAGQQSEALAAYDLYRMRFELAGLTREELVRSVAHRRLANTHRAPSGTVRFSISDFAPGSALLVSPPPDQPVDADYIVVPIPASGVVEVTRPLGTAPLRWVVRDSDAAVFGSGTANPTTGPALEVAISPGPRRLGNSARLSRLPADGSRRVLLILLDCADWRLIQYLRARGELPVLDSLLSEGFRAVLDSDPPLTAAALESLVWPGRRGAASFVGLVHQMGVELAGLASVGENPFGALSWILPENDDLFAAIGSAQHSAANLLFSHGGIRAGRHSEITGPRGQRRRLPIAQSSRDLDKSERERWPALAAATAERDAVHIRTIAAEFDTVHEIIRDGEVDFLALRVEPLDILTHAHFAETVRDGQDDGERLLFELYRYIDARLGATHNALDEDDVLIVMSDHGIRTSMEHSRQALFVAAGRGVPTGRAAGQPDLRGVSAVIADLMGLEQSWPRTGVAPWTRPDSEVGSASDPDAG